MSDNTTLNTGTGGDAIRDLNRLGAGVKTQVVQLDFGGGSANAEQLVSASNPLPVTDASDAVVGAAPPTTAIYQGWNNGGTMVGNTLTTPMPVSLAAAYFIQSVANSSTSQLSAGATFTGTIDSILNQPNVSLNIPSDQPLVVTLNQFESATANSIISSWQYQVPAGQGFNQAFSANGNSFQIIVTNIGTAATTTLAINTYYGTITPVDQGGNGQVAVYGSGDLQGVNLLEAAIRGDLALSTKPINQPATDVNNALILSDCPVMQRGWAVPGQQIIIDTQGYPTLSVSTGTASFSAVSGTNDPAGTWIALNLITPNASGLSNSIGVNNLGIIPCVTRYIKLTCNATGWFTYSLRSIQTASQIVTNAPVALSGTSGANGINAPGTYVAPATTNVAVQIKAGPGRLYFLSCSNPNATAVWLKLFNATSVTLGTTVAVQDIMIPAGLTLNIDINDLGMYFSSGIGAAVTAAQGTTNNIGLTTACGINYTYV